MLEKNFIPGAIEPKISAAWTEKQAFSIAHNADGPAYSIIMPPANVTGSLHLGHALTFTIQDILSRYHRMKGYNVLWQPGTDHAGIATQMVVERQLKAENLSRHDLGREKFLDRVWAWKEESGGTIVSQLKRLGASADWGRERFTMDDESNKAVTKVFVDLYKAGYIYRDLRLVNWDAALGSAISDLEVNQEDAPGKLYYIRYPKANGSGTITVATTRPETLFGDTAVAVHPDDERYADFKDGHLNLPLIERTIPIVQDLHSDPEKGSGAVKITPAHDFNDFEVGKRHNLPHINILTPDAKLNENVPEAYRGMTPLVAREKVVAALDEAGLLEKIEEIQHTVPISDRSGVIVEPYLTEQWFVDAKKLAGPAIDAVDAEITKFIPENWKKNYHEWMDNILPWCISRQIWWGHQIPAWFGPDDHIFVAETEAAALADAEAHYGKPVTLRQDQDVLDTWFSSALWPFVTLGWPHPDAVREKFYPTSVLVTGFDILFFWVARMVMMGCHFMKEVPFKDVYIHALVRDKHGQKMSKSKGNVIDPLVLMDEYGADAVRFSLALLASPGKDIKISEERVESARNFMTKIWNACRYLEMNAAHYDASFDPQQCAHPVNQWILFSFDALLKSLEGAYQSYQINTIAHGLYQFFWKTYCDWYLEITKPLLTGDDQEIATETRQTLAWVMGQFLHTLHPLAPFISEKLWAALGGAGMLVTGHWPTVDLPASYANAEKDVSFLIDLISGVRTVKAEMNIAPGAHATLSICLENQSLKAALENYAPILNRLGRMTLLFKESPLTSKEMQKCVPVLVGDETFYLPMEGLLDVPAEKQRLNKNMLKYEKELMGIMARLNREDFVAKAPAHVIETSTARRDELNGLISRVKAALARLEHF